VAVSDERVPRALDRGDRGRAGTILLGAAWLLWRAGPLACQRAWLAVVALTIEPAWPLTPLPLLIAVAAWFVFLCVPERSTAARLSLRPA